MLPGQRDRQGKGSAPRFSGSVRGLETLLGFNGGMKNTRKPNPRAHVATQKFTRLEAAVVAAIMVFPVAVTLLVVDLLLL